MNPDDERTIVSFWAGVKQLPAAMPSLHRWKDQDRIHYVTTHPGAKDPLEATLRKLAQAARALDAMERVAPYLIDQTARHARLVGQIRDIAERLWLWHGAIRMLRAHGNSALIKIVMDTSWVLVIKALFLGTVTADILNTENYESPPLPMLLAGNVWVTFPFLEMMQRRGRGILFTNPEGMLKCLSLSQWMTAYREFKRVYVRTGFSPSAAAYLQGLLYQYAHFVHNRHESFQERERCYDMPNYRAETPALPSRLLGGPLNDELIHVHEPDLYFTLRHLRAAHTFYTEGRWVPMGRPERKAVLRTLVAFIAAMLADRRMYTTMASEVRTNLMRRALQPGDSAIHHQTRGLKPSSTDFADASEILSVQRREFYNVINGKEGFLRDTPDTHMRIWMAEQERIMQHEPDVHETDEDAADQRERLWDYVSVERSSREFVILLIVQAAFDIYTRYACRVKERDEFDLYRHGYMDDASVPPPLDSPPDSPYEALRVLADQLNHKPPFFIVLSHMYAVVTPDAVRVSPRLEEAFTWWLREAVRGGQLSKDTIHPALCPLLLPLDQLIAEPVVSNGPRLSI